MSTLTVTLPPETARKLREKASSSGLSFERYIENRLGEFAESDTARAAPPHRTLDEILAPVRAGFAASGITEVELTEMYREARAVAWKERPQAETKS